MENRKTRHMIAAVCDGGGIGYKNELIVKIPDDMKRFKTLTLGNIVIMGRKTYESIGSTPLKCRNNIVVTRTGIEIPDSEINNLFQVKTIDEAFELAETLDGNEIYVIGGEQIYNAAIDMVDVLDITEINFLPYADAHFPDINNGKWLPVKRSEHYFTKTIPPYRFVTYKRVKK